MDVRTVVLSALLVCVAVAEQPASAQKYCQTVDLSYYPDGPVFDIYAGDTFDDDQFGPATITGEIQGSRVNVRSAPGGHHDGTYGLVGDPVDILGFGYGPSCDFWWKIRFPSSGYVGWIHTEYIQMQYPRGLWD